MRKMLVLLTLVFAVPGFVGSDLAHAAPGKEARKEQRKDMKETKRLHKDLERAARKWEKGVDKGKDKKIARQDAKLAEIYRGELKRLRAQGYPSRIPTPPPPPMAHPKHPPPPTPAYAPSNKSEALRDTVVTLRDLQSERSNGKARKKGVAKERAMLGELRKNVADRYQRKQRRFKR